MPDDKAPDPGTSSSLGTLMTLLAWLVFLGMLTLLFSDYLDGRSNPNQEIQSIVQNGITEVLLASNREGHYVANARINHREATVLIDTGATYVSVPEDIAIAAGLVAGPSMVVSTANGNISVYMTRIESLQIGEIRVNNIRATINPHMVDDYVLLGMSFLEKLEFSQSGGIMTLRQISSSTN